MASCDSESFWWGISGIFHCAGILKDHLFKSKTGTKWSLCVGEMRWHYQSRPMHQNDPLDFMVLFFIHGECFRQSWTVDYASANGFLDSFCHLA